MLFSELYLHWMIYVKICKVTLFLQSMGITQQNEIFKEEI